MARKVNSEEDSQVALSIQVATHGGLDARLFSVKEDVQLDAVKEYYERVKLAKAKMKAMKRCIFFQRTIKVIIVLTFVTVYWISGMANEG